MIADRSQELEHIPALGTLCPTHISHGLLCPWALNLAGGVSVKLPTIKLHTDYVIYFNQSD